MLVGSPSPSVSTLEEAHFDREGDEVDDHVEHEGHLHVVGEVRTAPRLGHLGVEGGEEVEAVDVGDVTFGSGGSLHTGQE